MNIILKKVISLFVVFAIATPILASETVFPFVVGKAIWFRSMVWILSALWGLLIIRERKYMPQQNFTFLLFGIVVFLQILSAISGYSLVNSFWTNLERMQGIIQSVHLLVFSLILFSIFKSFKEWIFILRSVVAVGLLVAFFGFLESFGIFLPNIFNIPFAPLTLEQTVAINYVPELEAYADLSYNVIPNSSLASTIGNSVYLSWYLSIVFIITLGLIFYDIKNKGMSLIIFSEKTSILNILTLLFSSWCILYNFSRGAILSITFGIVFFLVFVLFISRYKKLKLFLAGFLSIMFLGVFLITIMIPKIENDSLELRKTVVINNVPELEAYADLSYNGIYDLAVNNIDYSSKVNADLQEKIINKSLLKSEACREDVLFQKWLMGLQNQFWKCTGIMIALEKIPGNFTESIMQGFNLGDRSRSIKAGLEAWKVSPVLGTGPHNFSVAYYKSLDFDNFITSKSIMDDPHNSVIKTLSEGGILGLLSISLFFGYIFFLSCKRTLLSTNRYFWLVTATALVTYFFSSLLQVSTLSNQILLMILVSLIARSNVGFDRNSNSYKTDFKSNNAQIIYIAIVSPILLLVLNYHASIYEFARNADIDFNASEKWIVTENQQNVNSFPALSLWPRMEMIKKINLNFGVILEKESSVLDQVITIVDSEYESTKKMHPNDYVAMYEFGIFYFEAAKYQPVPAEKLRIISEKLEYLSPNIHPTLEIKIKHSIIDRDKERFVKLHKEWKEKLTYDEIHSADDITGIDYFNSYAELFD